LGGLALRTSRSLLIGPLSLDELLLVCGNVAHFGMGFGASGLLRSLPVMKKIYTNLIFFKLQSCIMLFAVQLSRHAYAGHVLYANHRLRRWSVIQSETAVSSWITQGIMRKVITRPTINDHRLCRWSPSDRRPHSCVPSLICNGLLSDEGGEEGQAN
jgi:hypothetical protein